MAEQNHFRCPVCYTVSELDPEEYKFEDGPRALKEKDYGRYIRKGTDVFNNRSTAKAYVCS